MQNSDRYFQGLYDHQRLLRAHGFEQWPDEVELAGYMFSLDDKISTLCEALGVHLTQDHLGRWVRTDMGGGDGQWTR